MAISRTHRVFDVAQRRGANCMADCRTTLITRLPNGTLVVSGLVNGARLAKRFSDDRLRNDDDAQRHALWLQRHRGKDAADEFLDNWCSGQ